MKRIYLQPSMKAIEAENEDLIMGSTDDYIETIYTDDPQNTGNALSRESYSVWSE